jgi:hypothetical protein
MENNKEPTLRFVRLTNGECLLADVDIDKDGFYVLTRPIQVVTDPDFMLQLQRKKQQALLMYAWLPSTMILGDAVTIAPEQVLYTAPLQESIASVYDAFAKKQYDPDKNKLEKVEDITAEVTGQSDKKVDVKDLLQEIVEGFKKNDKDKMN